MARPDFSEIGHTGGKITFQIQCDAKGGIAYSTKYEFSGGGPASLTGVYAHPEGFVCANIKMGGIGQPWNAPPFPNCIAVFMASDSEGRFGHECPQCKKHFRTTNIPATFPITCPYCGLRAESFHFLTPPQNAYVHHYIETLDNGLANIKPNSNADVVIDMNAVADLVPGKPRPDFYVASITQQTQFKCAKCTSFNDVRGRYAYCANCGWRNNRATAEAALAAIRDKLNADQVTPQDAVKQAVSEFDSCARNFVDELARRVPMKESRRNELQDLLFHSLERGESLLKGMFAIDFMRKMDGDREFLKRMFLRRHCYEHDGGHATARYVREANDAGIADGDLIRETKENAHNLISAINRMITSFDDDFHEIFKPDPFCIRIEEDRVKRREARRGG